MTRLSATAAAFGAATLTMALAAPQAAAHVTLETSTYPAGTTQKLVVRVPHGCGDSPTTGLEITMPDGLHSIRPMPKPGWRIDYDMEAVDPPAIHHGREVSERISVLRFTGGELPSHFYDEFAFRAALPAQAGTLWVPVRQMCAEGEILWHEIPADGDSHSVAAPAAPLVLAAAGEGHHGHHAQADHAAMAGDTYTVGDLTVTAPWARASAAMARAGAAFMQITNAGTEDRLVAAAADVSERIELHTHIMEDGVMRMREVEGGIAIGAESDTMLEPGGLHVMFLGLDGPFEEGTSFPLTLTFEQAGEVTVDVQVRSPGAGAMEGRGHSGHGHGDHGHGDHGHGDHGHGN